MRKLLLAVVLLAGCATSSKTYLPDGSEGFSINCDGSALSWSQCYKKAGDLCGAQGYKVLAGGNEGNAIVGGNQYGFAGGMIVTRSMLVKCGAQKDG